MERREFDSRNSRIDHILDQWPLSGGSEEEERVAKKSEVLSWLGNFEDNEIEDMLLILEKLEVISEYRIQKLLMKLSGELQKIFKADLPHVRFFPLGDSSATSGTNLLYNLCKQMEIGRKCFLYQHFQKIDLTGIRAMVFIDDIIGSGNQATRFARKKLSDIQVEKYYLVLFAFEAGLEKVRKEARFKKVIAAKELSEEYKAFSPKSRYFSNAEVKKRLEGICRKYGDRLYPKNPLGYEDSQSLLVFPHNVPNNTLPIIWAGSFDSESAPGVVWWPVWERIKRQAGSKVPPGGTPEPKSTKDTTQEAASPPKPKIFSKIYDLPEGFVNRPAEFKQLVRLLLKDEYREKHVAITAALKGAGGYGKTSLAKAICHDKRIWKAFDDGILWVTLGESLRPAALPEKINGLIFQLSGEKTVISDIETATSHLAKLLEPLHLLIVIDDVWNQAHTRDSATIPRDAKRVNVDAMKEGEAIELLSMCLPPGQCQEELKYLAEDRLGKWPLLLRLVNGVLYNHVYEDNQTLSDALVFVNSALDKRGLTAFDARNPESRDQAAAKTLDVSIGLLTEDESARFFELAIFPDDVNIPLESVQKLWAATGGFDDFDTEDLCSQLHRLSLLLNLDLSKRAIRLHDVVRGYLIHYLVNEAKIDRNAT